MRRQQRQLALCLPALSRAFLSALLVFRLSCQLPLQAVDNNGKKEERRKIRKGIESEGEDKIKEEHSEEEEERGSKALQRVVRIREKRRDVSSGSDNIKKKCI